MKSSPKKKPVVSRQPKNAAGPRTDWGEVADWYDQHVGESGGEYHREVVLPGAIRLLAPRAGEHALDVACGQGVLCRALRKRGMQVVGVDAAAELIAAARARGDEEIRYVVGDARNLSHLPADRFAAAACILALQNIQPIQPFFAGVQRVLKIGGKLVIVMMHPCFRGAKETAWGWDETQRVQYRRVDRYLTPRKAPIVTHPGKDPGQYTWTFHKPIQDYVKAMRNAGLLIDAIEEWPSHKTSEAGPRGAAENLARKEIPMFMALRAIKIAAPPAPSESDDVSGEIGNDSDVLSDQDV